MTLNAKYFNKFFLPLTMAVVATTTVALDAQAKTRGVSNQSSDTLSSHPQSGTPDKVSQTGKETTSTSAVSERPVAKTIVKTSSSASALQLKGATPLRTPNFTLAQSILPGKSPTATPSSPVPGTSSPSALPGSSTPGTATPGSIAPSGNSGTTMPAAPMPGTTVPGTTAPGTAPGTPMPGSEPSAMPTSPTQPGTMTAPDAAPGSMPTSPDATTPGAIPASPDSTVPGTTPPGNTTAPAASPAESTEQATGPATRVTTSYLGVGGNIGLSRGDTGLGRGSFSVLSKIGILPSVSVRPSVAISKNTTILIPLTYDFNLGEGPTSGLGFGAAPYLGVGVAVGTGDNSKTGLLVTGGIDVPIAEKFTANAAVNASVTGKTAVGIQLGVGYNFQGF